LPDAPGQPVWFLTLPVSAIEKDSRNDVYLRTAV
jgi:hypothetical protein